MFKVIFAAMISVTLVAALPQDRAQAQAATQQDTKAAQAKEEKAKAKEERAKEKAAAKEAKVKAREGRKRARQERLKAAEDRSAIHRKAVEARHQKMRDCTAKWQHKKSASDKSRNAYYAFMRTCQSE